MVFQQHNLCPHRTVLRTSSRSRPGAAGAEGRCPAQAEGLLARVGLSDKRDVHPFRLSGGQQQRIGIVLALALRPSLLLFDEPSSVWIPSSSGRCSASSRN